MIVSFLARRNRFFIRSFRELHEHTLVIKVQIFVISVCFSFCWFLLIKYLPDLDKLSFHVVDDLSICSIVVDIFRVFSFCFDFRGGFKSIKSVSESKRYRADVAFYYFDSFFRSWMKSKSFNVIMSVYQYNSYKNYGNDFDRNNVFFSFLFPFVPL